MLECFTNLYNVERASGDFVRAMIRRRNTTLLSRLSLPLGSETSRLYQHQASSQAASFSPFRVLVFFLACRCSRLSTFLTVASARVLSSSQRYRIIVMVQTASLVHRHQTFISPGRTNTHSRLPASSFFFLFFPIFRISSNVETLLQSQAGANINHADIAVYRNSTLDLHSLTLRIPFTLSQHSDYFSAV